MNKQRWLDAAECFDSWRIVPRIIVFSYMAFLGWLTHDLVTHYFAIVAAERTTQVTAFVSVVLPGAYGVFPWIYRIYADGARDWDAANRPAVNVTTTTPP